MYLYSMVLIHWNGQAGMALQTKKNSIRSIPTISLILSEMLFVSPKSSYLLRLNQLSTNQQELLTYVTIVCM